MNMYSSLDTRSNKGTVSVVLSLACITILNQSQSKSAFVVHQAGNQNNLLFLLYFLLPQEKFSCDDLHLHLLACGLL